ncbi:hypothetical protein COCCADRAFT_25976 [Bipolaris zeicola 26-R-13]|uniref:Methyltransferase type 11 domain-containing protein n=1 Tax=Cochliobolus carbonum (strain 26-R-13) TaxID=930089 RepID=W6Y260_COCC2|nr:uncharacterized protein COCCADRAFT_25976 [Bipolaris zeicola 26-R-13]EUC33802.1 hypothetical protein COCCADRAFT_25976 [Bipolaris zeicola 26-R-13]
MTSSKPSMDTLYSDFASKYETSSGGCTRQLATHLVSLLPPLSNNSHIHDNACGPGILAQELLLQNPSLHPSIICTDSSPQMITLAQHTLPTLTPSNTTTNLSFHVLPGDALSPLPSNSFTHSITNMGIFFFTNPLKGASEIHRTLSPTGTAIVTTWKSAGYMPVLHRAQKAVRPHDPPFEWPIAEEWYEAEHLRDILKKAGFESVEMSEVTVQFAGGSLQETCGFLADIWRQVGPKWTEKEYVEFGKQLVIEGRKEAVTAKRAVNGKKDAEIVEVVGFPMVAHVAVAKK